MSKVESDSFYVTDIKFCINVGKNYQSNFENTRKNREIIKLSRKSDFYGTKCLDREENDSYRLALRFIIALQLYAMKADSADL